MKRILSLFLAAVMILSNLPISAIAQDLQDSASAPAETETQSAETTAPTEAATEPAETTAPTEAATESAETTAPTEEATESAETTAPTEEATESAETTDPTEAVTEAAETTLPTETTAPAQTETVDVQFICEPAELNLTVYAVEGEKKTAIEKAEGNLYALVPGSYCYSAELQGYESVTEESFAVEAAQDTQKMTVILRKLEEGEENPSVHLETENQNGENPQDSDRKDPEGPVLNSISVEADKITVPGKAVLKINATDDSSDIDYIDGCIQIRYDHFKEVKDFVIYMNGDEGDAEGNFTEEISFTEYSASAVYELISLNLRDKAGNCRYYSSHPSQGYSESFPNEVKFQTVNPDPQKEDIHGPVLKSISAAETEISAPGKQVITVEIQDDHSGFLKGMVGISSVQHPDTSRGYELKPTGTPGIYEAVIDIRQYDEAGEYFVAHVDICDRAQNESSYYHEAPSPELNLLLPADIRYQVKNPNADHQAPVLSSISVDRNSVTVPGTLHFSAEVKDDVSGVDHVTVYYREKGSQNENTDWRNALSMKWNEAAGRFEADLKLNQYAVGGEYEISRVSVVDHADNYMEYVPDPDSHGEKLPLPQNVNFKIINPDPSKEDREDPRLISLTVDKTKITAPDRVTISAEITDDASGWEYGSVELYRIEADGSTRYKSESLSYNAETGKYECRFVFDQYSETAKYYVHKVYIQDKADHTSFYYSKDADQGEQEKKLPAEIQLEVENPNPEIKDTVAPEILSVSAESTDVKAPGEIRVFAKVKEEGSGVSYASLDLSRSDNPQEYIYISLKENKETGLFEGSYSLSPYQKDMDLSLYEIYIRDNNGNKTQYGGENPEKPLPNELKIHVSNDPKMVDTQGPKLLSVSADKKKVTVPGTVTLIVKAEDDVSGIAWIGATVVLSGDRGEEKYVRLAKDPSGEFYIGHLLLDQYVPSCELRLMEIQMADNAGNRADYGGDPEGRHYAGPLPGEVTIQVKNKNASMEDQKAPVLHSIKVDRTEITAPGSAKITAEITDDASGVKECMVHLRPISTEDHVRQKNIALKLNPETKLFEGIFQVDEYAEAAEYKLESVSLQDGVGHYVNLRKDQLPNVFTLKVINKNPNQGDKIAPRVKEVTALETEVQVPGIVHISAEISDNLSGVASAYVGFSNQNHQEMRTSLELNSKTGRYEGILILNQYLPDMTLSMNHILVEDAAGNTRNYTTSLHDDDLIPNQLEIRVKNPNPSMVDTMPPRITKLTADKSMVSAPGEVKLTAKIEDDLSGVSSVIAYFTRDNEFSNSAAVVNFWKNEKTGDFEGVLRVGSNERPGEYSIMSMTITDRAGNTMYVPADMESGIELLENVRITVFNQETVTPDYDAPQLISVTTDRTEFSVPGEFKVIAEVAKDPSGIRSAAAMISSGNIDGTNAEEHYVDLVLNEKTGKYEGTVRITEKTNVPAYYVQMVRLSDNAGNEMKASSENSGTYYYDATFPEVKVTVTDKDDQGGGEEEAEAVPMYRLYNPYTNEHLLSSNEGEKDGLVQAGWKLDGIAWNSANEGSLVYRLYNPYDQSHLYTLNQTEIQNCLKMGWKMDGGICHSADKNSGTPIYRLFNPYAKSHYHLYTASDAEIKLLTGAGWKLEGVAWYAAK